MDIIIYADIFFLINFCVDFCCFYIAASLIHLKLKAWRITAAAACGAVYSLLALKLGELSSFSALLIIIHIAVAFLLCSAAGAGLNMRNTLKMGGLFLLSAALTGGIFTALYIYASQSGLMIFVLLPVAAAVSFVYALLCKRRASEKNASVKIKYNGAELVLDAMVDSGNLLCDPFSGDSVVVVRSESLKKLIDVDENVRGFRAIPVKTAAGSSVMNGFRPDYIAVKCLCDRNFTEKTAVVASAPELSRECIISSELL